MKRLFLILLLATSVVLYNACGPFEFPGYDEGGDGDNTEESTPTPNPDPTPKPDPTPDPKPESVTATLTYSECAKAIGGYGKENNYNNSYGTWVICAYDFGSAIQLNSTKKTSYVGTPTFKGDITKISLQFVEKYTDDISLCTEATSGEFESFKCNGSSVEYTLTKSGHKSLYIRSSACARISSITIVAGGSATGGNDNNDDAGDDNNNDSGDNNDNGDNGGDGGNDDGGDNGGTTPAPNPSTSDKNWAELPVIVDANGDGRLDSNTSLYYATHLCAGGEKNAQRNGSARNYTVCYSAEHHCPLWVAAPRHRSYESGASRTDAYGKDPKIPSSIQYNSKDTGGGCNKGHMLGSAERLSSSATNRQVFYYTNIAPQYSETFNTGGGAWNNLEDHVDGLVCSDTLYVVIGCYFENFSKNGASASPQTISFGGRNDVSCPTMFYYALLRTKKGNSGKRVQDCSASELQCAAFVICHKMAKGHKPQAADMMSISELEELTGVTYFPNVPNAPKTTYNSGDWL